MSVVFIPVPQNVWIKVLTDLGFPQAIIEQEKRKLLHWD